MRRGRGLVVQETLRSSMPLLSPGAAAKLIRELDRKWAGDQQARQIELARLRDAYVTQYIAWRLAALPENSSAPPSDLLKTAEHILSKSNASTLALELEKRTPGEERMFSTAKVMWHKLIKAEQVAPARPWSKNAKEQPETTGNLFRKLLENTTTPDAGRLLLREYIAHHCMHMLKIYERAKNINPEFVTGELKHHLAQLLAAATKP